MQQLVIADAVKCFARCLLSPEGASSLRLIKHKARVNDVTTVYCVAFTVANIHVKQKSTSARMLLVFFDGCLLLLLLLFGLLFHYS